MSRRINFTLTVEQLAALEQAINSSPYPEVRQRAIAIRMLHLGQHPEHVAEMVLVRVTQSTPSTNAGGNKGLRVCGMGIERDDLPKPTVPTCRKWSGY